MSSINAYVSRKNRGPRPAPAEFVCQLLRVDRPILHGAEGFLDAGPVDLDEAFVAGLQLISDDTGRLTMIAMDQRGSLQKMLHPEDPKAATYAEMEAVKLGVTSALAPHASGYLLDPDFGVGPAINRFALPGRTGLL